MATFGRRWATAVMVVAAAAGARPASAQRPATSLDLRDYAGNSEAMLRDTREGVRDILRNAGVDVVSDGAPAFIVNILPAAIARQQGKPAEAMGFAPVGAGGHGHILYVLDAQVNATMRTSRAAKAAVLAAVIAHELGHLLLPPMAHTPDGIMRPNWNVDDLNQAGRGYLLFNPRQAEAIRKALAAN